jgi:glycosyltransferase involved in cell wall biosynthesis
MPILCLLFRRPTPYFFSIERVFEQLTRRLDKNFQAEKVTLPLYSSSLTSIFRNLLFVRKLKADIYHISGDVHYAVLALPRSKTILTIHDCVFLRRPAGIKRSLLKWIFLDMPVRHCPMITTISEATKQDIIRHTRCSPDKITVIPNPVNDIIYYLPAVFNEAYPIILFLGSTPNKNLERVIPALEGINCMLNIVGEIPEAHLALLFQYRIPYTRRAGLTDKELADQYAEADLVLFPSTFEGFGLPVIEAQKAGRPVVTSNISPMKEVAGDAACLVDPYEIGSIRKGVLSVIRDRAFRERLVQKGFENVERFSPERTARHYQDCYNKLLPV